MSQQFARLRNFKMRESASLRLVIVGILTLILLIPAAMVKGLISERQARRDSAVSEVSQKWGNAQTITGPVLTIPYRTWHKDTNGNPVATRHCAHFLPDRLSIDSKVESRVRYRGIYEVILYDGKVSLSGFFPAPDMDQFNIPTEDVLSQESFISLGITDMKGIKDITGLTWADKEVTVTPGTRINAISTGVSSRVAIDPESDRIAYFVDLDLRGSGQIRFVPVGKVTEAAISSNWDTPSFEGEFLPGRREINANGFTANWKILSLNRSYPQSWTDGVKNLISSSFGVKLLMPVDGYQRNMRTVKYAIMFIFLTFLTFFMIEILNKRAIHPIQYMLIGSALIIFYTLLLSLSEHFKFNTSYTISSAATVAMITLYTRSVFKNNRITLSVAGIVTGLYSFLFVVLQAEDYALLFGSFGLFALLALTMYLTRKVDWFNVLKQPEEFTVEPC